MEIITTESALEYRLKASSSNANGIMEEIIVHFPSEHVLTATISFGYYQIVSSDNVRHRDLFDACFENSVDQQLVLKAANSLCQVLQTKGDMFADDMRTFSQCEISSVLRNGFSIDDIDKIDLLDNFFNSYDMEHFVPEGKDDLIWCALQSVKDTGFHEKWLMNLSTACFDDAAESYPTTAEMREVYTVSSSVLGNDKATKTVTQGLSKGEGNLRK